MAVTPDGVFLYAAIYSSGQVVKISLDNYRIVKTIHLGSGAPRHLVIAPKSGYLYVSDMYYGKVFTVSLADDQVIKSCYFGSNLNTIVLSGDEKYLLYLPGDGTVKTVIWKRDLNSGKFLSMIQLKVGLLTGHGEGISLRDWMFLLMEVQWHLPISLTVK